MKSVKLVAETFYIYDRIEELSWYFSLYDFFDLYDNLDIHDYMDQDTKDLILEIEKTEAFIFGDNGTPVSDLDWDKVKQIFERRTLNTETISESQYSNPNFSLIQWR